MRKDIAEQFMLYGQGYLDFLAEKEKEVRSSMARLHRRPTATPPEIVPQNDPITPPPAPPTTLESPPSPPSPPLETPLDRHPHPAVTPPSPPHHPPPPSPSFHTPKRLYRS